MKKLLGCLLCVALLAFGAQAHALAINPTSPVPLLTGPETSQAAINAIVLPYVAPAVELYKADVGGSESGALWDSYATVFNGDLSGATISYTPPGDIVGPPSYLLVKDGAQDPAWYLFGLSLAGWDGQEDLVLSGFWPGNGAISHVTLYGVQAVPEPLTMLLLGSGIFGLALFGRGRGKFKT